MKDEFYAHSLDGKPHEEWQRLEDHLKNVAEMARGFAGDFNAGDWGYLAGLWHDLGKYSREFQARLLVAADPDASIETKPGRVDHSTAGAKHACKSPKDKLITYTVSVQKKSCLNVEEGGG